MNKHAYLIMAHNDLYILEKLLSLIDNEHNDIYLHLDKKMKNINLDNLKKSVKKSPIYFIKRQNVHWSSYSQIKCELSLLKTATQNNKYSYYHLLSGVDLLIKNSETIYNYFEENLGTEFISYKSFKDTTSEELQRIKYYHFLNGNARHKNKLIRNISNLVHDKMITIQKKNRIDRLRKNNLEIRKGANWFSITDDLARYVVSKEKEIKKMYNHTNCADEIFLQTIVYNSKFKDKISKKYSEEHQNAKRHIDWNRGNPYTYTIKDYQELITCDEFFARKFSSQADREIIDKIYKTLKGNKNDKSKHNSSNI